MNNPLLVSPSWLHEHLEDDDLVILDATTLFDFDNPDIPAISARSREAYTAAHIPGAVFADLVVDLAEPNSALHCLALPSDKFQQAIRGLGVSDDSHVVIYDHGPTVWAARLWWNLRFEGHANVSVLDGGLPAWRAAGYATQSGPARPAPGTFTAKRRPELYASASDVLARIDSPSTVTINSLPAEAYAAAHIPGSVNVPSVGLFNADGTVASPDAARARFAAVGALDEDKDVITYCGGGIAAAFGAFQLARLGRDDVRVYDGSMTEWVMDPSRPVESS